MRVNIQRSNLRTPRYQIASIESLPDRKGFVVACTDGYSYPFPFPNIAALCGAIGVKPEHVRAAVEAEGFEIAELEIRRIRLEGMDSDGAIPYPGMCGEYLNRVRDWQCAWVRDAWADAKADELNELRSGAAGAMAWWRPRSYSAAIEQTVPAGTAGKSPGVSTVWGRMWAESLADVDSAVAPAPEPLVTDDERQKIDPDPLVTGEKGSTLPSAGTGWFRDVFEDARRRSAGRPDWFKPASLLERVERASEGWIDPESEPNQYKQIALDLAALVADKQRQYGDSAGRTGAILRVLYPNGIGPEDYDRALLIVRVLDKISRLATNKQDLGGESPWRDIAGYALLALESPQKGF